MATWYCSANMSGQSLHLDYPLGVQKYVHSMFPPTSLRNVSEFFIILFQITLGDKCQVFYLNFPKRENRLLGEMPKSVIKHFQREDILNENDNSCLV